MLRIIPLGGIGHVTNNMFVYEYGEGQNVERLIVDCGIGFPEEEMLGADLLVPDISYLQGKENSIVGIVLTHGHDDHIAGLPYILPQLNMDIPVFASPLTAGFAQENFKEFGLKTQIQTFPRDQILQLGSFGIDPVAITHSVPDTKHLAITTPEGVIYHGSDFKFDWTPIDGHRPDVQKIAYYGHKGVLALLSDCLRIENEGYTLSESKVGENLSREIRDVKGKVIVTTMSSNIHRIQQAIDAAVEHHRKIAFIGRSVEENIRISQQLGFLQIPEKVVINKRRIKQFKDNQLCLIVAGSQGQIGSTLARIATNQHQLVSIKTGDHVVFSADPIPGNERNAYRAVDNLAKLGATVSYREVQDTLHVSGHASADELRLLLTLTKPKYTIPIGGTFRHMTQYRLLATGMGWRDEQVLLLNDGEIAGISRDKIWVDNKIKLKTIIVDGLGIGDVGPLVLSDRKKMSQSGMMVIAIPVDQNKNQIKGRPEVITRGFVFARQSQELLEAIADETQKHLLAGMQIRDWKDKRDEVTEELEKFVFLETQREPLVLITLVKS
ncbi:ribonuclease J [Candidatus Beckwithbacteria bacterium]|nr:ribonuclease J [Candidatus Beckwithbacteria bacterium]